MSNSMRCAGCRLPFGTLSWHDPETGERATRVSERMIRLCETCALVRRSGGGVFAMSTEPAGQGQQDSGGDRPTWGGLTRGELEQLAGTDYPIAPVARALLDAKPDGF